MNLDHEETHKKKTISGIKWNALNQLLGQSFQFIVGIILMRRLAPETFGLFAMVAVIVNFLGILRNSGLNSSLIQKREITNYDKNTVFWFNLLIGGILTFILFILSPYIASFYNETKLMVITQVLAFSFVIQAMGNTHYRLLSKELRYKEIFVIRTVALCISGLLAILAAFQNYGIWALVVNRMGQVIITSILAFFYYNFKPTLYFSNSLFREHIKFGFPLLGSKAFNYWTTNGDRLVVGKFIGSESLGFYSRALSLVYLPTHKLSLILTNVMFQSFSLIKNDINRIKNIYLKLIRILIFIIFPLMGFVFVSAESIVIILVGKKWLEIVPLLKLFSLAMIFRISYALVPNVLLSQGKSNIVFKNSIFSGITLLTGFVISAQFGIYYVAWSFLISNIIIMLWKFQSLKKVLNLSILKQLTNIFPHLILFVTLIILSIITYNELSNINYHYLTLIIAGLFILGWPAGLYILSKKYFLEILALRKEIFK